jgi:glycosyltransferase involved in cell wall biosynthesis
MIPLSGMGVLAATAATPVLLAAAYAARIRRGTRNAAASAARDPAAWPRVDVVVPVHDESGYVAGKIANLRAIDYPEELLRFWIVDGASSDGTRARATAATAGDARFAILDAGRADKTAQLNFALRHCRADWILCTDADARFGPSLLKALVREAGRGQPAGAVGSTVVPDRPHPWEALHWRIADGMRLAEARAGSASIVTGPCYLARRDLLLPFPDDVVADDVHAAFRSAAAGLRVGFIEGGVTELRSPVSIRELLRHKYRKGRAFVGEICGQLPRAAALPSPHREMFLWRAAQVLSIPFAAASAAALLAAIAASGPAGAAAEASVFAGALVVLALRPRWRAAIGVATLLAAVLGAAILFYPFTRRRGAFSKIDAGRRAAPEPDPS